MPVPLISVIIPCRDAAGFLGEAIESVLTQTGPSAEVIVSDDGSVDGSPVIAEGFGGRVRLIRASASSGPSHARNLGLAVAAGNYLMFLDADDRLGPGALEALAAVLAADPEPFTVAACPWRTLRPAGDGTWRENPPVCAWEAPDFDLLRSWMRGWYIPPCAVLWKRGALERAGGWDEGQRFNADGELMMRGLLRGLRILRTTHGIAYYRRFETTRTSLSTAHRHPDYLPSHMRIWERLEAELDAAGRLDTYRVDIGRAYHVLARNFFESNRPLARECDLRARRLAGRRCIHGSFAHRAVCHAVGLEVKSDIARWVRRFLQ